MEGVSVQVVVAEIPSPFALVEVAGSLALVVSDDVPGPLAEALSRVLSTIRGTIAEPSPGEQQTVA